MLLQLSKTVKQSPKSPQIFENNGTFCADRPFSKNRSETNCQKSFVFNQLVSELQSYILSTTTETFWYFRLNGLWFCFNRTSFQQQLKLLNLVKWSCIFIASIVHPFNNNWNIPQLSANRSPKQLQSYILSTTTETSFSDLGLDPSTGFNRTSFQQQLKLHRIDSGWIQSVVSFNRTSFQQQLKHGHGQDKCFACHRFNRTSFQQQLKRVVVFTLPCASLASIVHPFNNNWNNGTWRLSTRISGFNRTSFQQQLKPRTAHDNKMRQIASIVHPFNNNWNLVVVVSCVKRKLQSYILSTTTETSSRLSELHLLLMLQSYILSTTTETPSERTRLS